MPDTRSWAQLEQAICAKARRLVSRYGFNEADREDIEQELWLGVLRCRCNTASENPSDSGTEISSATALDHVVEQTATAILRYKPLGCHTSQIDDLIGAVQTNGNSDAFEQHLLRLDIEQLIALLPSDLKKLCDRLRIESPAAVVQTDHMSHILTEAQLDRLRCIFRAANLHEYLN